MLTVTQVAMECEESRWDPEREHVVQAAIAAREDALISGASLGDAAAVAFDAINVYYRRKYSEMFR